MPQWISPDRENIFPNLHRSIYEKTSEENDRNNCAAWAAGDASRWMQPPVEPWHYWPAEAPLDLDVDSFVKAYELIGFEICADATYEAGYQKLAIYGYPDRTFSHAARLNENGSWSSKLGCWEDIKHDTLRALEGRWPAYGKVYVYMKRKIVVDEAGNVIETHEHAGDFKEW